MTEWPLVVLLLGILAAGVACFGLWLRQRPLAQLAALAALQSRFDRLEGEVRSSATVRAAPMAMGQGLYGVKR